MSEHEEVSAKDELIEIAEALQEADRMEKEGKLAKENVRGPFFELISEVVREEVPLQRQTVTVEPNAEFEVEEWRAKEYPEWRVIAINGSADGMEIILEEDERYKKYEFNHNGFRFGRTIRMEGKGFEAEDFYNEVNEGLGGDSEGDELGLELLSCVTKQEVITYSVDEKKLAKLMAENPEVVPFVQKFINPGVPTPALLPIKKAKEEDE